MNDIIIQNGKSLSVINVTGTHEKLPVANYLLQYDEVRDLYSLEIQSDFIIPEKIYGDFSYTERWKKSFESTTKNLGILLSGYKGNGKTFTAQYFCKQMNRPVIFITKGYSGVSFESFITNPILNDSILMIDEYEKLYNVDNENEDSLLSVMDGLYSTHMIFLLTVNDSREISDKLKNRLGRIKYHKQYSLIEPSVIEDTIKDLLVHKEHEKSLRDVLDIIPTISLDILISLIKEVNLFNESATECVKHLNIVKEKTYFDVTVVKGKERKHCVPAEVTLPDGRINLYYLEDLDDEEYDKWPTGRILLKDHTLTKISGGVSFKWKEDIEIILIREEIESFLAF